MSLTESLSRIDELQAQINSLPPLSEAEITSLRAYYKVKLPYSTMLWKKIRSRSRKPR